MSIESDIEDAVTAATDIRLRKDSKTMKVRLAILLGELVLNTIGVILALEAHYEGALGVAGIIGTTMHKAFESEEKSGQR